MKRKLPTRAMVVFLLVSLGPSFTVAQAVARPTQAREKPAAGTRSVYVGSQVCAQCHRPIYNSFSKTDMGRSMSSVTPAILPNLPPAGAIFDSAHNRHFSVSVQQGQLLQSEWETGEDQKDVFRETKKVEWLIGAGANGIGALVRRGDSVFEAPLTFYAKTRSWALSPGYEDADRGFNRPIDGSCITCHSGRPNPVFGSAGQFREPPFSELAIGCENCHGPGQAHVLEMRKGSDAEDNSHSIVNPAKLSPWLADNICMSCHQTGGARILQPGKNYQDFRPGQPLDNTLAILMAPATREDPPHTDLLQHYFSMLLSKCYQKSEGRLSCITCHSPHVQPSRDDAPAYYRGKCLGCHTESSCTLPQATRQEKEVPDDCAGCHMPKRDIAEISHASLTNHRIVIGPDEPFPDLTFRLTTPALPDLIHIDVIPDQQGAAPPLITLLQAYGELGVGHPEFFERYLDVGKQLEASDPDNSHVLEALAARSLRQRSADGSTEGMQYLRRAIDRGSTTAWDFETLANRLISARRYADAVACLRTGVQRVPYDPKLYALLADSYLALNRPREAVRTITRALQLFPEIDGLRTLLKQAEEALGRPQQP
jgi:hypothetical protein